MFREEVVRPYRVNWGQQLTSTGSGQCGVNQNRTMDSHHSSSTVSTVCPEKAVYKRWTYSNYRAITHYFLTLDLKPRFLSIVADAILGVTIFGRKGVMMTHQKTPVASIGPLDASYIDICLLVQHMNKIFEFCFSINTESHFIVVIVIICQILAIKNA